jgi:hypothetical protein
MKNTLLYTITFALALFLLASGTATAVDNSDPSMEPVKQKLGIIKYDKKKAWEGYTLYAPKHFNSTHIMDTDGRLINTWNSEYEPGQSVYLLENGNLLHCCFTHNTSFIGGGEGGRLEEYNWEGDMVWSMLYSDETKLMHHDIEPMPNGNILAMVVEKNQKSSACRLVSTACVMTIFFQSILWRLRDSAPRAMKLYGNGMYGTTLSRIMTSQRITMGSLLSTRNWFPSNQSGGKE